MKKCYVLLLFTMLGFTINAQSVWDGTAMTWTKGDGTSTNPYLIENGQHLAYLSEQVRNGETYKNKFFKLNNDLDMGATADHKFTPIGVFDEYTDSSKPELGIVDDSKYFLGVFDGNNKKIDNIHVFFIDEQSVGGTGLFACISTGAAIKNLGIGENSIIEGGDGTGSLVGNMKGGIIENCYNEGLVTGIGGSFGTGGLIGVGEYGKITNCYNTGMVKGVSDVGGIVGYVDKNFTIDNCYNCGMINASGLFVGGLVGLMYAGTITNSYNIGMISDGPLFVNAIVGATNMDPFVIKNCYYSKELTNIGEEITNGISEKSVEEMKAASFITLLNGGQNPIAWTADTRNINGGFPILVWQSSPVTGIQNASEKTDCNIYVVDKSIVVECSENVPCQMNVINLNGKIINSQTFLKNNSLNITDSGIYIVTVNINSQQYTSKVVIK